MLSKVGKAPSSRTIEVGMYARFVTELESSIMVDVNHVQALIPDKGAIATDDLIHNLTSS